MCVCMRALLFPDQKWRFFCTSFGRGKKGKRYTKEREGLFFRFITRTPLCSFFVRAAPILRRERERGVVKEACCRRWRSFEEKKEETEATEEEKEDILGKRRERRRKV